MTCEKESEATPRISFGEWFENLKAEHTLRQIQNIRGGFFKREDKITILEGLLYERIRDGEPTTELMEAIALLQENLIQDEQLQRTVDNSFTAQVNGVIAFAIGIVATAFSYLSMPLCRQSQSRFCVGARVIPDALADQFREPAHKSRVLPANIKAD